MVERDLTGAFFCFQSPQGIGGDKDIERDPEIDECSLKSHSPLLFLLVFCRNKGAFICSLDLYDFPAPGQLAVPL